MLDRQLLTFGREPEVELHQVEGDNHEVNDDIEMDNVETVPISNNSKFDTDEALEFPDINKELVISHLNTCSQVLNEPSISFDQIHT